MLDSAPVAVVFPRRPPRDRGEPASPARTVPTTPIGRAGDDSGLHGVKVLLRGCPRSHRPARCRSDPLHMWILAVAPQGTVKWFNAEKGFGFIAPETVAQDCSSTTRAIQSSGFRSLEENQRVEFEVQPGPEGPAGRHRPAHLLSDRRLQPAIGRQGAGDPPRVAGTGVFRPRASVGRGNTVPGPPPVATSGRRWRCRRSPCRPPVDPVVADRSPCRSSVLRSGRDRDVTQSTRSSRRHVRSSLPTPRSVAGHASSTLRGTKRATVMGARVRSR